MISKTTPETGAVTYIYNTDNTLVTATDAKNQHKVYSYGAYGRIIRISRGTNGSVSQIICTDLPNVLLQRSVST